MNLTSKLAEFVWVKVGAPATFAKLVAEALEQKNLKDTLTKKQTEAVIWHFLEDGKVAQALLQPGMVDVIKDQLPGHLGYVVFLLQKEGLTKDTDVKKLLKTLKTGNGVRI